MAEYIERSAAIRALTLHDCDTCIAKKYCSHWKEDEE